MGKQAVYYFFAMIIIISKVIHQCHLTSDN